MRNRITPRNRSLYGFVGKLYVLAFSHWRVSGVDGRNRLELHFLESALPENSDWISCSGCENSRSSGKKPNFDPKPQKTRNDSSYQSVVVRGKNRILTQNREKLEMTVPISWRWVIFYLNHFGQMKRCFK